MTHAGCTLILLSLFLPVATAQESADQKYAVIAGLADKGLHDMVTEEAKAFLRDHARHPRADQVRYRLASALFELGRASEAAPLFRAVATPGFEYEAEATFRLGQCELRAKNLDEARAALERTLALNKTYLHVAAAFLIGEAMFQKGDYDTAAKRYGEVLAADANGEYAREARYGVAWSAFRQKRFADAVRAADAFLARHRGDDLEGELRFLKGEALLETGKAEDALGAYRLVQSGPFTDAALRGSGFAYIDLDRPADAAKAFAALLEKVPDSRFADEARLQCGIQQLKAGDPKAAAATLSARGAKDDPELLYWLAQAQAKSGDAKAALAATDRALSMKPDPTQKERLQIARGDALFDLGRTEDATRAYGATSSDYALHAAAVASMNDGRADEAKRLAISLLDRFPDSTYATSAHAVLGEALMKARDYAGAASHLEIVTTRTKEGPERVRAWSRLGWAAYLGGDGRKAAACFANATASADAAEREEARYMLGAAHEAAGSPSAAASAWEKHLGEFPSGAHRAEVLLGLARVRPADADKYLTEIAEKYKDHGSASSALLQLAERLQEQGDRKQAAERYGEILRRFPGGSAAPAACYGLAWCQFEAGAFADANKTLAGMPTRDVDAALVTAAAELQVFAAAKAGDLEGARAAFLRLLSSGADPDRLAAAARSAASSFSDAGRPGDADLLLNAWQKSQPKGGAAALERAWLAIDAKDADAAEKLVFEAQKSGAGGADFAEAAFFCAELLFDAKQDARAVRLYEISATTGGSTVQDKALYKDGYARLRSEDTEGAATRFEALVTKHPESDLAGESLYLLGECRFRLGRFEDAIAPLTTLTQKVPSHQVIPKALFRLGVALCHVKQFDQGETVLTDLVRRFPRFESLNEAELWRGRALVARGNPRGARQAFDRVVAGDQGVLAARARIELGRLQFSDGDTEKALAEFLKVAILYGSADEVSEGLFLAGMCLEKLGDPAKAKSQYEEVVSKYPTTPFAAEARKRLRGG